MAKSGFADGRLRSFVERVERLEEEKKALSDDIKEVYAEAKGEGFCTKTMRKVVALRKLDRADFQEQQAMLDMYLAVFGMSDAPLLDYIDQQKQSDDDAEKAELASA